MEQTPQQAAGQAQRPPGVGAEAGGDGAVGHGRGGAGGGAAGDPRRVPGIAGVTQHVVVAGRTEGELGQMQRRDLQRAGALKRAMTVASCGGGLVGADTWRPSWRSCPCGRTCPCGPAARRRVALWRCRRRWRRRSLGGGKRLVGVERDDAVGELVAGRKPLDGRLGRLDARDLLVADGLRQAPRAESCRARSWLGRWREDAAEVIDVGAERQLRGHLGLPCRRGSAACALAAARRSGGISKPAAGPASAAGPGCGLIVGSAMVELPGARAMKPSRMARRPQQGRHASGATARAFRRQQRSLWRRTSTPPKTWSLGASFRASPVRPIACAAWAAWR